MVLEILIVRKNTQWNLQPLWWNHNTWEFGCSVACHLWFIIRNDLKETPESLLGTGRNGAASEKHKLGSVKYTTLEDQRAQQQYVLR